MEKGNHIRTPCFRASQLRSFCLIAFLLCQSFQSVVSLPTIASDVEVASKIAAEPVMELSQSEKTSEKAVKTFSSDKVKGPPKTKWSQWFSMLFAALFSIPMLISVKDQPLPTDADSVTSNEIPSASERPGAPSLLTWTQQHRDIVQQRLNGITAKGRFATNREINEMFYEAEAEISKKPLAEVHKALNVKPLSTYTPPPWSKEFQANPSTAPTISTYTPPHWTNEIQANPSTAPTISTYTPPHWTNKIQANPSIAPTISTYTPPHWTNEIQSGNLDHMGNHPSWQTLAVDNHNQFASQGHYQNLHNFHDAGLNQPPYSAQHVGSDGLNHYILPDVAHAQYAHPYSYEPAPSYQVARKDGTGYFYPQSQQSQDVPHYENHADSEKVLDHSKEWEDLGGEIDKYRHQEGFKIDDLPHIDDIVNHNGFKAPAPHDFYFTSPHKPEVPNPYEHTATSWKNPNLPEESETGFSDIDKDPRFHPKINNHQPIGTSNDGDQMTRSSRPLGLKYPEFDFLSPNQYHHVWPTNEAPITSNMEKPRLTYSQVLTA
ncbi:uncharacterized protein MELLADRAFT_101564 [Melampsora larici-populina 98AG31]|uniref:Secreted protein n=1 Tax=Melampsora larici-populina (strain 98AG31 / pathotype 3-4-7) TaxID=747676 RepID=F4R692_MELLP|nr:uncharacterized protein MELLADRAFT_101564 [Melampsora larici-populina 98AG31]EGG12506.1 hypothetical protein MELLADRAFT_101564 [Melampsora larici-populina 98AG31]